MTYPGNSSLGDEVRQRILSTFSQSLDLAETGKAQEAALGCDFILELDPEFEPARLLKERLESGGDGQEMGDLRAIARGETPPPPTPSTPDEPSPDDLFDLEDFDLPGLDEDSGRELDEAPSLDPVTAPGPPPEPRETPAPEAGLRTELEGLVKARSYQEVMDRASRHRDEVMGDPELAELVQEAQSRLEAQPYVESFLQKAEAALREGDLQTAHAVLDKARSLEPDHPRIAELSAEIAGASPRAGSEPEAAADATADATSGATVDESPGGPPEGVGADPGPETEPTHEDDRIAQLLAEGQEAADRGDHQSAIDAWSRIFLIDVDHEEAARRIEEARRSKAERERQVEEIFHDGLDALDSDDRETARERFERVLEVQPNHLAAREYLQQIESGGPVTGPGSSPEEAAGVQDLGSFDLEDLAEGEDREGSEEPLKQEILVPPAPGEALEEPASEVSGQEAAASRRVAAGASSGLRSFLVIGGAVLVLVLAAGWFLLQNKERFFPNSSADQAASAARQDAGPSMLERALELREGGRTRMAVGLLKRIRPDQADYQRAQELIAEWEAPAEDEVAESSEPTISAAELERRDDLIARARQAFDRSEFLLALELYDDARDIAPLEGESRERFQEAARELEPLSSQIELFHQGEYEMVLPELWRMLEDDPSNRDVRRLLVDSYHNRGVRELQRGDAGRAAAEFREALSLAPDDRELQRHFQFAQTYQQRSKDLLYRIYVKYLPFR